MLLSLFARNYVLQLCHWLPQATECVMRAPRSSPIRAPAQSSMRCSAQTPAVHGAPKEATRNALDTLFEGVVQSADFASGVSLLALRGACAT